MSSGPGRKPRVSDEQILELLQETNDPVLSTSEVAEELPIGRRGTLKRLQSLAEDGRLESKSIGGRNTVWWATEDDIPGSSVSEEPVQRGETPTFETEEPVSIDPEMQDSLTPEIEDVIREWKPGRSSDGREERRSIGRVALEWLRERDEPASASDFKNALYEDYHIEGQGRDSWWRRTVRPALEHAEENGLVEYSHGLHEYEWIGDSHSP